MKFIASIAFAFGLVAAVSYVQANVNAVTYIAAPILRTYPYAYSAHSSSLGTPTQQQYHAQDGLGQYAYGYAEPHSAKQEVRTLDGTTRGSYSYFDPEGKLQIVDYTADDDGFHVAATNLPRAITAVEPSQQQQQQQTQQELEQKQQEFEQQQQQFLGQQPFRGRAASVGSTVPTDTATVGGIRLAGHAENVVRLDAGRVAGGESTATGANTGSVQLHQPVADTIAVAATKATQLKRQEEQWKLQGLLQQQQQQQQQQQRAFISHFLPTSMPRAVIPTIHNYGYPFRYYYY